MDDSLREINAVIGVVGSFVSLPDSRVAAQAMPAAFDADHIHSAAKVASQSLNALDSSGQRIAQVDLVYREGRVILKNLRGGILVILCTRNINLPLLNLTANGAARKLAAELRPPKPAALPRADAPASARSESAARPAALADPPVPPLTAELTLEALSLVTEAAKRRLHLHAIDSIGVWLACPHYRSVLLEPKSRQIDLAGIASEGKAIEALFGELGLESNRWSNTLYGNQRLSFGEIKRQIIVQVFLDRYDMYHRLDLGPFLSQVGPALAPTALVLMGLQAVDRDERVLRDLCALFLENDLGVGPAESEIDASHVTRLCAEDWGWYKTASTNLDRVTTFAALELEPKDVRVIAERVGRLRQSIESAPKGLRWQTRARLGETVKWYESPQEY
ncbi:MAG: hypothetical protein M1482_12535 [Chloroflexi bacterium]|nr:hypothetical protein [Chloroflexota bacterium]